MPTWEKLAEDKKPLEKITGFHMAQVKYAHPISPNDTSIRILRRPLTLGKFDLLSCLAQGDLCAANDIKFCKTSSAS